jgi:predicted enzyme related to lactoylglutathione lyase
MPPECRAGAVLYVKHVQELAMFYSEVCALQVRPADERSLILESSRFQLVLIRVPDDAAQRIVIEDPPIAREWTQIKLVFFVANIAQARARAVGLRGTVYPPEHEWQFEGCTVCDGVDPEGNIFQLRTAADPG